MMKSRLDYAAVAPEIMAALLAQEKATRQVSIPLPLREMIKIRVSQINGCAYCLDMHIPEARRAGVSRQKIDVLAAWRESPAFDQRERAALAWAEALTQVATTGAPDGDYETLAASFDQHEQVELTLVITTINTWNRFAIAFHAMHPLRDDA